MLVVVNCLAFERGFGATDCETCPPTLAMVYPCLRRLSPGPSCQAVLHRGWGWADLGTG